MPDEQELRGYYRERETEELLELSRCESDEMTETALKLVHEELANRGVSDAEMAPVQPETQEIPEEFVEVWSSSNQGDISVAEAELDAAGIEFLTLNEASGATGFAGTLELGEVSIMVHDEDAGRARELLSKLDAPAEGDDVEAGETR